MTDVHYTQVSHSFLLSYFSLFLAILKQLLLATRISKFIPGYQLLTVRVVHYDRRSI